MKALRMSPAKLQRGSFYSTMIIVAMFGLFLLASLKLAPAYLDNNIIMNAMDGIKANNDISTMSISEVRTALMRTLNTNRVENFDASNVVVTKEGGMDYIDINYETRVPLFYNISAVVSFQNRVDKF